MKKKERRTIKELLKYFRYTLRYTKDWRGSMTGNPDPQPLKSFDEFIKRCRHIARRTRKLL